MNEIYTGNCLEIMTEMEDQSFDLCLTDPPYNAKNIGPNERKYSLGSMQLPAEEYKRFCKKWFLEASRIAKTLVFTSGIANLSLYPQPDWIICWHKPAAVSFNRMGGYNVWEPILIYGHKWTKKNRLPQDYLQYNTLNFKKGAEKDHPCPKPESLWEKLLVTFCPEGGSVFDPFIGSGTTAVVAKNNGRQYVGIDINPEYVEMTKGRLRQELLITS